jgi:Domain of unknown function (DUF4397)
MSNLIHLVRSAARIASVAATLVILTGCGAIVSSTPQSQVRVVAVSPDAPRLDIYQGSNPLAHNLGFGAVTSYIPLSPGSDTIAASTAGTRQLLSVAKTNFASSGQYTVLIGNSASNMQQLTLTDQNQSAPPGEIALRFIDQATRVAATDIYLVPAGQKFTTVAPLVTNLLFGGNTGYLNIPTGTYSLVMLPTGTTPSSGIAAPFTGPQVTYSAGSVHTVILIDQQLASTPGLQVITASDFDPVTN